MVCNLTSPNLVLWKVLLTYLLLVKGSFKDQNLLNAVLELMEAIILLMLRCLTILRWSVDHHLLILTMHLQQITFLFHLVFHLVIQKTSPGLKTCTDTDSIPSHF
jgi:hypothetical protein